jgi:xanthine dehydrogenase accessory factor
VKSNTDIAQLLHANDAVLVTIDSFEGSSPREVGAWMLVLAGDVHGTVGGGNLEFQAIAYARELLVANDMQRADTLRRYPLGPSLGQCCGGVVHLKFACVEAGDTTKIIANYIISTSENSSKNFPIALFGGGHVGKALVNVLGNLPCSVHWIDSRDEIFPSDVPRRVQCEHSEPVHAAVNDLSAGSHVLIMSFNHAEDLDVVAQCLLRLRSQNDLPFIGLIGSKTKWATFRHRLEERGFTAQEIGRVTCPIGIDDLPGKEPEVIAVSVAAQLLKLRNLGH